MGPDWQATDGLEILPGVVLIEERGPGGGTSVVVSPGAAFDLPVLAVRIDP